MVFFIFASISAITRNSVNNCLPCSEQTPLLGGLELALMKRDRERFKRLDQWWSHFVSLPLFCFGPSGREELSHAVSIVHTFGLIKLRKHVQLEVS